MSGRIAIAGDLKFLNLGEVVQLLGTTAETGTLCITSQYASQPGMIYIEKGNPINATNGSKAGLDALFSLFGWIDGQFEFVKENVTCEKAITKSRMEIILDGLRLLDEGKVAVLGPPNSQLAPSSDMVAKSGSLPLIKGPLVDYSYVVDEEAFYDGDEIVQEGNHGNWVWVILEGTAEIVKDTPKGRLKLLQIGDGAFLGSIAALLKGDNMRSATVTAAGNIQLGMLDSQLLTSELAHLSRDFRDFVSCLDARLKKTTNMLVDIYSGDTKFAGLIKGKKPLIKQGQDEKRLFRIRSGEAWVARETDDGTVPLVGLKKGDFLGCIPFLDMGHEPFSASVFASPDLKLAAINPDDFQKEYDNFSATLKNIFAHLATCISVSTMIGCDYFHKTFAK
jgi:CRP-like cAMP-binding protein